MIFSKLAKLVKLECFHLVLLTVVVVLYLLSNSFIMAVVELTKTVSYISEAFGERF